MTFLLLAAAGVPDPVPAVGRFIGTVLGAAIVAVSIVLILRHRSALRSDEEVNLVATLLVGVPPLPPLAAMGFLVAVGVWIDAGLLPRFFVGVWGAVLILLVSVLLLAGYDLLQVRGVGRRHGLELLQENRRKLEQEVAEYHRRRSPQPGTNGEHKH